MLIGSLTFDYAHRYTTQHYSTIGGGEKKDKVFLAIGAKKMNRAEKK